MVAKTRPKKGLVFLFVWYNKLMNKRNRVLVSVAGAIVVGTGVFCGNTFAADSAESEFSVSITPSATIVIPSSPVNLIVEPTAAGVFANGSFNVTAYTNNPDGYTVTMTTNNTSLTSNTVSISTGDPYTISTLSANTTQANFEINKWGISLNSGSTYIPMTASSTLMDEDTATGAQGDTQAIGYATKLDLETVPGTYSTTIGFAITAKIDTTPPGVQPGSINENGNYPANSLLRAFELAYVNAGKPIYIADPNATNGWRPMTKNDTTGEVRFAMQDISLTFTEGASTQGVCVWADPSNRSTNYVDEALVMDLRDGKSYWIVKAEDGKCWMSQNLDLDLNASTPLEHATSDIGWTSGNAQASWTPPTTLSSASGAGDAYYTPESINPGDKWIVTSGNNNADAVYTTLADCISHSTTQTEDECRHYHIGNYYNWNAATAQTSSASLGYDDNAPDSICPAGWRLPDAEDTTDEFNNLLEQSGIVYGGGFVSGGFQLMRFSPLYFVRGGRVAFGDYDTVAETGLYFTRTAGPNYGSDETCAKTLLFGDVWGSIGIDTAQHEWGRENGQSVRCIAR